MSKSTNPLIVCLCGSTRFMDELDEVNRRLTISGYIVLAPSCNLNEPHPLWDSEHKRAALKPRLDALHRSKIDLAHDVVIVTDRTGYVGDSTRAEIDYAATCGKRLWWWAR